MWKSQWSSSRFSHHWSLLFQRRSKVKKSQYILDNDIKGPGGELFTEALDRMIQDGKLFKTATVDEWLDCNLTLGLKQPVL